MGKTYTVGSILVGMALEYPGLRMAWTSHHNNTTSNTFRSIQGLVRRPKIYPHLDHSSRSDGISASHGQEAIRFNNGSYLMFGAREQGFGRGLDALDIEVFDEAQILTIKALEDMVPATNQARHIHGGLIFFLGTPPRPTDPGEAFSAKREQALKAKQDDADANMVYVEISADPDAKPDDRSQWPIMNPSYPHRTPLESMLRMRANIPDDESWKREAMGIWPKKAGLSLITKQMWSDLLDPESEPLDRVSFGIYVNKQQTRSAIGVAGYRADGLIHVGVVPAQRDNAGEASLPGMGWIPDRALQLRNDWNPCVTVIDEKSEAGGIVDDIRKLGVDVVTTNALSYAKACSKFLSVVKDRELRHRGAEPLRDSVTSGKKRDLMDAWAWDRKAPDSDITQLVAVTLALYGLVHYGQPPQTNVWGFLS